MNDYKDRLPATLLTGAEVIAELRLDCAEGGREHRDLKAYALRRLKYMRKIRAIPFVRLGHRSYVYPRQGIERFKKLNLVDAIE